VIQVQTEATRNITTKTFVSKKTREQLSLRTILDTLWLSYYYPSSTMILKYDDMPTFKKHRSASAASLESNQSSISKSSSTASNNMDWSMTMNNNNNSIWNEYLAADFSHPAACEGYLYVQNRSFWKLSKHAWKRKYVALRRDSLYITEDKCDSVSESEKIECIKIRTDTGIYPRDHEGEKNKYYIRITSGKQNYTLRSEVEDDRNTWITSLLMSMSNTLFGNSTASARQRASSSEKSDEEVD